MRKIARPTAAPVDKQGPYQRPGSHIPGQGRHPAITAGHAHLLCGEANGVGCPSRGSLQSITDTLGALAPGNVIRGDAN